MRRIGTELGLNQALQTDGIALKCGGAGRNGTADLDTVGGALCTPHSGVSWRNPYVESLTPEG